MTERQTDNPSSESSTDHPVAVEHISSQPLEQLWQRLTTPDGVEALLGEGARLGGKGESWHAVDGTHGVTRSYHPAQQVRVSWHADADAPATVVDLQLAPHDEGTRLRLHHEHLVAGMPRAALAARWQGALARLAGD
ncbi:hypothetical protein BH24ACT8_BH24ACT8_04660 [soil metagenome]